MPLSDDLPRVLTDFGNIVIALPILAVALSWLWRARQFVVCTVLALNATCTIAATIMLKSLSRQSGGAFAQTLWHLTRGAPSGHAAVSTIVYGGIGVLFALRARGFARVLGIGAAVALMLGVDVTRVTLGYHSPADMLTGVALGSVFVLLTALVAQRSSQRWPSMLGLLVMLAATAAAMHLTGLRFDSNAVL